MEAAAAQARAIDGDRDTVEMSTLANGVALYHLGEGRLPEALDAMDRAMDVLRAVGGAHDLDGQVGAAANRHRRGRGAGPGRMPAAQLRHRDEPRHPEGG